MKFPLVTSLVVCLSLNACTKTPAARVQEEETALVGAMLTYKRLYGSFPSEGRVRKKAPPPRKKGGKDIPPPPVSNKPIIDELMGVTSSMVLYKPEPKSMDASGQLLDPWGTPYKFDNPDHNTMIVTSAGPDKAFGTPDDVSKTAQ